MHTNYLSNILPDVYYHLRKHLSADNLTMKAVMGPDEAWTVSFLNRPGYKASTLTLHIPPTSVTRRSKATWDDVSIRIHLDGISEASNEQVEYKLATQVRSLSKSDVAQHLRTAMENAQTVSIDAFNLSTRRNLDPEPMWAYDIVSHHIRDLPSNQLMIDEKGDIHFRVWDTSCHITFQLERMRVTVAGKIMLSTRTNDAASLTSFIARVANPFLETRGYNNADHDMRKLQRTIRSRMPWQLLLEKSSDKDELICAHQKKLESMDDLAGKDHQFDPRSLKITPIDHNIPYKWGFGLDAFWRASELYVLHNSDKKIGVVGVQNGCICAYHFFQEGAPSDAAWKSVQQMAEKRNLHIVQNPRFTEGFLIDSQGEWHREDKIPAGTTFSNSLVLSGFEGSTLPDDLKVVGSLTLGNHYNHLPKGLEVTVLDISRSSVEVIPGDCRVTSRLRANNSKVRTICDGFTAAYVELRETRHLESLPDNFEVKSINLIGSGLQRLNNLKTDSIDLTASCVEEISDTVFLRGNPLNQHVNILGSSSGAGPQFFG